LQSALVEEVGRKFRRGRKQSMSVREQEQRKQEALRKAKEVEKRIERRMRETDRRAHEAELRAEEVRRRIETGDVEPRPLPGMREDSIPSD